MVANGPKCWRVDDCDGAVPVSPHAMFLLLRTGRRSEYRLGAGGGDTGPRQQKQSPAAAGEKHKYGPHSSSLIRLRAAAAGRWYDESFTPLPHITSTILLSITQGRGLRWWSKNNYGEIFLLCCDIFARTRPFKGQVSGGELVPEPEPPSHNWSFCC